MSRPIYKLCLIRGYTEAWHQLSADEQGKIWTAVGENMERQGMKMVGPFYNSRWSNDKYASFFILEYPHVDAAIADTAAVEAFGLFRYLISETILAVVDEPGASSQEATS